MRPAVHFVGFRGDEYLSAIRVWGPPDFFHMSWDTRAKREIAPGDTVVFATGPHDQPAHERNSSDTRECARLEQLSNAAGALLEQRFVGGSSG